MKQAIALWRNNKQLISFLVLVALSILAALPVITYDSWPMNHEWGNFFIRTQIYAEHFRNFDLFPVWSSVDNYGFGSPQPALYHKIFYTTSGAILALLGPEHLKASIEIAICLWLLIGSLGIFSLARACGTGHVVALSSGAMLIASNYTTTNWLVRGAMAEFSGAMAVPWVLLGYIISIKKNKISVILPVALTALMLAHSVMAYYLVIICVATGVILLALKKINLSIVTPKNIALPVALFAILAGINIIVLKVMGSGYSILRITPDEYLPENLMRPWTSYFYDPAFQWGQAWQAMTVQIDALVILATIFALALIATRKLFAKETTHNSPIQGHTIALICIISIGLLLQTSIAIPFYRYFPGANFIQFPWRLLAIITPTSIVLSMIALRHATPKLSNTFAIIIAAVMLITSGSFNKISYGPISQQMLSSDGLVFSAFGEYSPISMEIIDKKTIAEIESAIVTDGCAIIGKDQVLESSSRSYVINCEKTAVFALPEIASLAHTVKVNDGRAHYCLHRDDRRALCSVDLPQGESRVEIIYPTFKSLIEAILKGRRNIL